MTNKIKIEIEVDIDFYWDWYLKKHNTSGYTKEELTPSIIQSIKWNAEHWWTSGDYFLDDQYLKDFMKTVIHNTAFNKQHLMIVKTDKEQPIDKNSVIRLY